MKALDIVLGPFSPEDLKRFIADTLYCDPERSAPLARLFFDKTQGNPFFFTQLLTSLHRQGFVIFDAHQREWRAAERIAAAIPKSPDDEGGPCGPPSSCCGCLCRRLRRARAAP